MRKDIANNTYRSYNMVEETHWIKAVAYNAIQPMLLQSGCADKAGSFGCEIGSEILVVLRMKSHSNINGNCQNLR
jgi:hypothetical protein